MDVRLPKLGEGVDSGSVVTVFVKEGDLIKKGQTILELENEKAVAPIPSPGEGRIANIRVKPGDKLSVGQVILTLASSAAGGAVSAPASSPPSEKTAAPKARREPATAPEPLRDAKSNEISDEPPSRGDRPSARAGFPPAAAPSLRKLAKELGIDLTRVQGSESGGRIVLQDIKSYIQRLQQAAFSTPRERPVPASLESIDFAQWGPVSVKPVSGLRQVISRRMTDSWTSIPHVTQFDTADVTELMGVRKKHAPAYAAQGGHLTVTAFVVKALAALLKKHPVFNASLDEGKQCVVFKQYYHIGIAVDTEAGLVVPVLRDADSKSLLQISKEIQQFAEKARDRKLSGDEMKGGTFTLSNQGGIGSGHFTPIINKPEAAILGIGRGALEATVRGQAILPRHRLPLALSYDHRLIDGANAARFMVELVASLEEFAETEIKL
jgi:pyruvate dehydrogenase E2 component (dihydrolipoamide acetyltransferase)